MREEQSYRYERLPKYNEPLEIKTGREVRRERRKKERQRSKQ